MPPRPTILGRMAAQNRFGLTAVPQRRCQRLPAASDLVLQLATSVAHVLASVAIAFAAGCLLAAVATYAGATRLLIDGIVTPFLNAFAGIGWLFLALLWFGLNSATVIFAVTLILVPFVTINVRTGLREADLDLRELGRSLTRSRIRQSRIDRRFDRG
jgi:ABC-type nitrate/sulfonate/bicarbonate transport system permease component